jgi:Myb-like DNA-binding domain/Zinc finger, ZZ type
MPRRKGKQSNGRNTPVAPSAPAKSDKADGARASVIDDAPATAAATDPQRAPPPQMHADDELVLPSEKRRGVYECDYCHSDISQLPRIRCAVCPDFDLCLDCFATTDHSSAIARLKAAATTHSELAADGIASTMVTGLSCASHDDTHGYRVCDSTRYPISGSARHVIKLPPACVPVPGDRDDEWNDAKVEHRMILNDDPKSIWTAEEDLRLLDAIKTHGLGNWIDIADAIGGNGSTGKTPKRCMERYFDSFLGRYGHVIPEFTIVEENPNDDEIIPNVPESNDGDAMDDDDESVPSNKRRPITRPPSTVSASSVGGRARKRYKVVPTESLPEYEEWWPEPYIPPVQGVEMGQQVARDLSRKSELDFVKLTSAASSKEEVDKIRAEWEEKCRTNMVGAPTVLPPRPEDSDTLPGAELSGFMPRRGDFDIEHDNEAEGAIAEMEFLETDTEQEKQLKVKVLLIYYQKQVEREKRKQFILTRRLYDYRQYIENEQALPRDERDLRHRMRLFERFHTPAEHEQFIDEIIKAKRLRKEIAKLQMYRRIGIRSLVEAEKYELDKSRRQFHKAAQLHLEAKQAAVATAIAGASCVSTTTPAVPIASAISSNGSDVTDSLWKNYRTSDRKARRSMNRTSSGVSSTAASETKDDALPVATEEVAATPEADKMAEKKGIDMDIDSGDAKVAAVDATVDVQGDNEMPVNGEEENNKFSISLSRGYDLLSRREVELCVDLRIYPEQYLQIKTALIQESLKNGLLENEGPGSSRRTVIKMDVKRRGEIVDFFLRAGWISPTLANVARTVTPPPLAPRSD